MKRPATGSMSVALLDPSLPWPPEVGYARPHQMGTYLLLLRATDVGALKALAGFRVQEELVRRLGGELLDFRFLSGRYDAMLLARLPDDGSDVLLSLRACAEDFHCEAIRTYEPDEIDGLLRRHTEAEAGGAA